MLYILRNSLYCLLYSVTPGNSSSTAANTAVIIGGSVGATVLVLLISVTVVVTGTRIVLREQAVRYYTSSVLLQLSQCLFGDTSMIHHFSGVFYHRKKMSYNLENARRSPSGNLVLKKLWKVM